MITGKSSATDFDPFLPEIETFFLRQGLLSGDRVSSHDVHVGVSGGADSVFLAFLLSRFEPLRGQLTLLHFNHRTRGSENDSDIHFLRTLAHTLNCELKIGNSPECSTAKSRSENVLRTQRYAFFRSVLDDSPRNILFLAHNKDDLVETILMNMFRGTGPRGILGIPEVRGKRIFRPLMGISSETIRNVLQKSEIPFREDHSNQDPAFLRNRVRHELVPLIRKLFPQRGDHHLAGLSALLKQEFAPPDSTEWIANILESRFQDRIIFSLSRYQKLSPSRQSLFLRILLEAISETGTPVPEERNLLTSLSRSPIHEGPMGHGWILKIEFQELHLVYKGYQNASLPGRWEIPLDRQTIDRLQAGDQSEATLILPTEDRLLFRWEKETRNWTRWEKGLTGSRQCLIPPDLCLGDSTALLVADSGPGRDFIVVPGKKSSLSRIISKKRFPQSIRRRLPVLIHKNRVLWVPYAVPLNSGWTQESEQTNEGLSIIFEERRGTPWKRSSGNP
ncbi:MAG: tRNA lysidine(34) synthetase TilS [Leptospirales bacterium]